MAGGFGNRSDTGKSSYASVNVTNSNSNSANTISAVSHHSAISMDRSSGGGGCGGGYCCLRCCGRSCRSSNQSGYSSIRNCHGFFCGCYVNEESRPKWLTLFYNFTKSIIWFILLSFFSIFLLFGPAAQSLADVEKKGDLVFMYLRIVMLVFFIVDIAVRCVVEEEYFMFTLCGAARARSELSSASTAPPPRSSTISGDAKESTCVIGSFLFWCDFLSTLSILYDLSFLNNHHLHPVLNMIKLNDGIPIPGNFMGYRFTRLAPNTLEFNVLVVILRTARCARFVQSRAAVGASNRINWFGMCNILRWLNPCFYYHIWHIKHEEERRSLSAIGEDEADLSVVGGATVDGANRKGKDLQIRGVLAAVHAEAEKEASEERQRKNRSGRSIWGKVKSTLLLGSDKKLVRKHEAAFKIQRAWRSHVRCEFDDELGDTTCTDPNQLATSIRSNHIKQPENTVRKKSTLASFTHTNASRKQSGDFTTPKSRFQSRAGKENESQVGSDMRELTGQRVAIGALLILVCTVLCTYTESSTTQIKTMVVLHAQTKTPAYIDRALDAAISSSVPTLYEYQPAVNATPYYPNSSFNGTNLTDRNILNITVTDIERTSIGLFDNSDLVKQEALVDIVATLFIILFWFAGVLAFSGPVMLLVITPVEQMVRLLSMLTHDPLGYQSTARFKKFLLDEDAISKNTRWTRDVLKGMETSYLKSTILRIGSLMKVGFGAAGVQIIQNNLEKGQNKNMLILNSQGTTVSCIFLFSDIRQFTDATEQLQEEVFVFTNRIAAVIHSICNSYGGAANKNVGDAFLLSWSLDDKGTSEGGNGPLKAKHNQADKALLSVIKICISLTYDNYFLEPLSDAARSRLKTKLKDRTGSVVQMGFGLHAGKAVQGAIGSQRKIDATYVAESVERTEFLESSTKKYGLKLLMSGEFHRLLQSRTQDRCRKVDQILLLDEDDEYYEEDDNELRGEKMDLFTFDMDVDVMQRACSTRGIMKNGENENLSNAGSFREVRNRRRSQTVRNRRKGYGTRTTSGNADRNQNNRSSKSEINDGDLFPGGQPSSNSVLNSDNEFKLNIQKTPELVLPTGPALYSQNVWLSPDMKKIREKYVQGLFFSKKYKSGLEAFYNKEWDDAKKCFQDILENFDDGPSKYFLAQIEQNNGIPPKDFREYGNAD